MHFRKIFAARSPFIAGRVVRNFAASFHVFKRGQVFVDLRHAWNSKGQIGFVLGDLSDIVTSGPANAALDQVLKTCVAPSSLVVPPCGIKNATRAMSPHPSPRLAAFGIDPVCQHGPVFFVVQVVHVGLVPTFKTAESFHDRVVGLINRGAKNTRPMAFELTSHESNDRVRISETISRAMNRHETSAIVDVIQQRFLLRRCDRIDVCKNQ